MLKAIVVDDEIRIRTGIASFINNNCTGFEVLYTFSDGAEVIEFLEENDTDLIITDIRMKDISGIELAEYVYNNKPDIRVVILSGYADFEYAQAAIKYNVKHYITKPTDFGELKNVLSTLHDSIKAEKYNEVDVFLSKMRSLCTEIVHGNAETAEEILISLLNDNNHKHTQPGQFAYNLFELIFDRLHSGLQVQLPADKFHYDELAVITDIDKTIQMSLTILNSLMAQFTDNTVGTDSIAISTIIRFVNEHFSENISLQDAAEKVFFNTTYCSRFFKKHTGQNFSDYLLQVRMEEAARLLQQNIKISEISKRCGYSSSGYFTRIFKEYYKCTPSEYQKKLST